MKKEDIKVTVTLNDINHAPLFNSWDYICDKYGLNRWCMNEGLADNGDTIDISLEDAEYIGLIED